DSNAERWRAGLQRARNGAVEPSRKRFGIGQYQRPGELRRNFSEQIEPFGAERWFEVRESCRASARPSNALDEAAAGRVLHRHEHIGHVRHSLPNCSGSGRGVGKNDLRAVSGELGSLTLHERKVARWPTYIEEDVLSFDPVQLLQGLLERRKPSLGFMVRWRYAH